MGTVFLEGEHVSVTCPSCKVGHTIPLSLYETMQARKGNNGVHAYCPNGHQWHLAIGATEEEKLRRERDRLKQAVAERDDEINRQLNLRETAERSASAYKGQATRLRNRAKAGICPCCNRHFTNLERHMTTQHKDWPGETPDLEVVEGGKS
jgi:hypothetical protein